jgi:hypothetical protein
MFEHKARVLLILPQEVVDQARVLAGKTTTTLKIPVSLQIVLRALIEEGLKREGDRGLFANIEGQANAVRRIRSLTALGGRGGAGRPAGAQARGRPRRASGAQGAIEAHNPGASRTPEDTAEAARLSGEE